MAVALFRSQILQGKVPELAHGADLAAVRRRNGDDVPDVQLLLSLPRGKFDTYGALKTEDVQYVAESQEREEKWDNTFIESELHRKAGGVMSSISHVRRTSLQAVQLAALVVQRQGAVDARLASADRKMQLVKLSTQMILDQVARRKMQQMRESIGRRQSLSCNNGEVGRWRRLQANAHEVGQKRIKQQEVKATKRTLKNFSMGVDDQGRGRICTSRRHASVTGASKELEEARSLAAVSISLQQTTGTLT